MIIDQDGLFNGDRLAACSKMARLYFVHLMGCANSCGRMEINYERIVAKAFSRWKHSERPSEPEIFSYLKEYSEHRLLFLYYAGSVLWGQWAAKPNTFGKYQSERDKKTPSPPAEEFATWRDTYQQKKSADVRPYFFAISEIPQNQIDRNLREIGTDSAQNCAEFPQDSPIGIGVGVGIGNGIGESQNPSAQPSASPTADTSSKPATPKKKLPKQADPRFTPIHDFIRECCKHAAKKLGRAVPFVWGPAEGKQLSDWLAQAPESEAPLEFCKELVRNRFRSKDPPGKRPCTWIPHLSTYATGPVDRYNKNPEEQRRDATKAQQREDSTITAAKTILARIEGRDPETVGATVNCDE